MLTGALIFAFLLSAGSGALPTTIEETNTLTPGETVRLTSPNYPQPYGTNDRRQWEYSCAQEDDNILVMTCPVFDVKSPDDCIHDRLIVTSQGQRDIECGTKNVSTVTTTGWMLLTFWSNNMTVGAGFNCTISCLVKPDTTNNTALTCGNHTLTDGQTVTVQSENFPMFYPTYYRCQWELSCETEADNQLFFSCPTFDLQYTRKSLYDRLIVTSRGSRETKTGSDSPHGTVTSTGWTRLTFFSDYYSAYEHQGFQCHITCQAK